MRFSHSPAIWSGYPELAAGALFASGITRDADVEAPLSRHAAAAAGRLTAASEGELPEIRAWRRAFARMGLKPTQYRCASEALLRRFRKEGALPRIHPLIDLCNAASLATAIPIAVLDADRLEQWVEVRHAGGDETYETFSGEIENPAAGEVIFADAAGRAHARRWTNRQSGLSAVRDDTAAVLIVAEAMHDGAAGDVARLLETMSCEIGAAWPVQPRTAMLTVSAPGFEF